MSGVRRMLWSLSSGTLLQWSWGMQVRMLCRPITRAHVLQQESVKPACGGSPECLREWELDASLILLDCEGSGAHIACCLAAVTATLRWTLQP